jgi:hypothetical protein
LDCICSIESNDGDPTGCGQINSQCDGMNGCNWDVNSCSCGPYQIKADYFTDCSTFGPALPIQNWRDCAVNVTCAKQCVKNYFARYGTKCTKKASANINCADYAGIHNGGPGGCSAAGTADYRQTLANSKCCQQSGDC